MNTPSFISITDSGLSRAGCTADGAWQQETLISSPELRCVAVDPRHPQFMYLGVGEQGVMRSRDAGKTWQPAGLDGRIVKSLAVSAFQNGQASGSGVVFAGTKSPAAIYLSKDGGEHWTECEGFRRIRSRWFWFSPAEPPFTAYVQAIALSPTDPNLIMVGIEAGAVVCSRDGGETWSDHRPGAVRDCHSLTFHATHGEWAYEGGGSGGAFSRDGGKTWRQPREGMDRRYCWAVVADPAHPEVWYISASPSPFKAHSQDNAQAYIFRSVGGAAWEKLSGGLPQPLDSMPYALLTDRTAPGRLYAALSNGEVWAAEDHGDHWEKLPFKLDRIHSATMLQPLNSNQ